MKRLVKALVGLIAVGVSRWPAGCFCRSPQPYKGYQEAETFVVITPGSYQGSMARSLAEAGVVREQDRVSRRGLAPWRGATAAGR